MLLFCPKTVFKFSYNHISSMYFMRNSTDFVAKLSNFKTNSTCCVKRMICLTARLMLLFCKKENFNFG